MTCTDWQIEFGLARIFAGFVISFATMFQKAFRLCSSTLQFRLCSLTLLFDCTVWDYRSEDASLVATYQHRSHNNAQRACAMSGESYEQRLTRAVLRELSYESSNGALYEHLQ